MIIKFLEITSNPKIMRFLLLSTLIVVSTAGCDRFLAQEKQPPCDEKCVAKYLCDELNITFFDDKRSFIYAKRATENILTRSFCEYKEGLILPEEDTWKKRLSLDTNQETKNIETK